MKRSISKFLLVWGFLALVTVAGRGQDIILDPIEQNPVLPSARSLASGNWGYSALIGSNASEILRRATRPVVVYVFDTGGRYDHPGLQKAAWNERGRIFTGEPDGADGNGHSTHVASSYAGVGASGEAVGICDGLLSKGLIRVVPIKVLTNGGSGTFAYTNAALDAVLPEVKKLIAEGTFVVYNFSLGGGTAILPDTESRLKAAKDAGVFIVAAAGNSGAEGVIFPASGPSAHAVAAVTSTLAKASFSTTGEEVWGAAPGAGIYGCYPPNLYRELSGTSMATPHMGAVAAIVASVYPSATAAQVQAHIEKYARDLGDTGRDKLFGYGFPNITAMLANAPGADPGPDPDPDPNPDPDPGPDPGYPERTMPMGLNQTFTVPYQILNDPSGKVYRLQFKIRADYTSKKPVATAAKDWQAATVEHFRNRGYILPVGSDDYTAAYWVAFFYNMLLKREGYNVAVTSMTLNLSGVEVERKTFSAPTAGNIRRAKKTGASTVAALLFSQN